MDAMKRFLRNTRYILPTKPLIVLVILTFFVLLPVICWNLEHSAYFIQGDLNYAAYLKRLANNRRIAEARTYFNDQFAKRQLPFNYHQMTPNITAKRSFPNLAIIIVATNRDTHKVDAYEPKYLTQALHHLLLAVNHDVKHFGKRWSNISIAMCNADPVPDRFFELRLLTRYFDFIQTNSPKAKTSTLCQSKLHLNVCLAVAKEKYANVDKFLVIEDDLLANKDMFTGLAQLFRGLRKRFKTEVSSKLGYVQLYYPKHAVRFSLVDANSWLELLLISTALVAILYALYFRTHMRSLLWTYNALLLAVLTVICVLIVVAVGRPHWRYGYHRFARSYSLVEPLSTSTAAVLVDRQFVNAMLQSDFVKKCRPIDLLANLMESVAIEEQRRILSVNFNLFKHIGLYSAFKKTIINPHLVE